MPERWLAASVHVFTALGIGCAYLATDAVLQQRWETVFAWLGVALIIDGVDGIFARRWRVKEVLPRFSGERLDNIIDYVTYVFVPVLALTQAGYLQGGLGQVLAVLILMSSLYHFIDEGSKAEDHSFVGFPVIWNIVAFYVFALDLPLPLVLLLVIVCIGMTFVPLKWVHPVRVARARTLTLAMAGLWGVAAVATVVQGFPASLLWKACLAVVLAYGIGLVVYARYAD